MESSNFSKEQKIFIKKLYTECNNEICNKIRLSCKCSAFVGRPSKIKNKQSFNEMLIYYKKGYITMQTIQKYLRFLEVLFSDI